MDANDGIYPIAYAAVEAETEASWSWFLELIGIDLELTNSFHITFMCDRQKGLLQAIQRLFPNAEGNNCVRHLYNNFKNNGHFRRKVLKDCLWKAARATYPKAFDDAMKQLKTLKAPTHEWLSKVDPKSWSKSHFLTRSKSDILLNNNSECWNKGIRSLIMKRIVSKQEEAGKMKGSICTRIMKKLNQRSLDAISNFSVSAGKNKFEVRSTPGHQHVVDIQHRTCSCRKWDLSGIPCGHAVAVIRELQLNPVDFVHQCYETTTQLAIYSNLIEPVRGFEQWDPVTDMEPIRPPTIRRPTGRPKKNRNKEPDEAPTTKKLSRRNIPNKCSKCGEKGHHYISCKKTTAAASAATFAGGTSAPTVTVLLIPNPAPRSKLPIKRKKKEFVPPRLNPEPTQDAILTQGSHSSNPISQKLKRPRKD